MSRLLLAALVAVVAGSLRVGAEAPDPTFTRDVAPILQKHCQECHRAGGGGPFHLITYDQVYRRRTKILETTRTRTMPPWKPVAGYGDFVGVRGLSTQEIATIARWVETGAAEGDPTDLPPRLAIEAAAARGTPDLVLRSEPFTVPARGGDVYR
jgi:mono/diheme cytochrome c family protein